MTARRGTTTFYCPFCGEETIRPVDPPGPAAGGPAAGASAWYRCESCTRVYAVTTPAAARVGTPTGGT